MDPTVPLFSRGTADFGDCVIFVRVKARVSAVVGASTHVHVEQQLSWRLEGWHVLAPRRHLVTAVEAGVQIGLHSSFLFHASHLESSA